MDKQTIIVLPLRQSSAGVGVTNHEILGPFLITR